MPLAGLAARMTKRAWSWPCTHSNCRPAGCVPVHKYQKTSFAEPYLACKGLQR